MDLVQANTRTPRLTLDFLSLPSTASRQLQVLPESGEPRYPERRPAGVFVGADGSLFIQDLYAHWGRCVNASANTTVP